MSTRTFFRSVVYLMAAGMVAVAAVVLLLNGQVPASVPAQAPALELNQFVDALRAVDGKGQVDLAELKKRHASLETFVASLASHSPDLTPDAFPITAAFCYDPKVRLASTVITDGTLASKTHEARSRARSRNSSLKRCEVMFDLKSEIRNQRFCNPFGIERSPCR